MWLFFFFANRSVVILLKYNVHLTGVGEWEVLYGVWHTGAERVKKTLHMHVVRNENILPKTLHMHMVRNENILPKC